ncbi:MAG: hypothetical protein AB7W16_20330 [Candidatus Obscuribacterales bacterium]
MPTEPTETEDWSEKLSAFHMVPDESNHYMGKIESLEEVLRLMTEPSARGIDFYAYYVVLTRLSELYRLAGYADTSKEVLLKLDRILKAFLETGSDPLLFACAQDIALGLGELSEYEAAIEIVDFYRKRCSNLRVKEALFQVRSRIEADREMETKRSRKIAELPVHPAAFLS